jgi:hypothetical protein
MLTNVRLVKDNSSSALWPAVTIIEEYPIAKPFVDEEPSAQRLILSCGHWVINTYGSIVQKRFLGDSLRCKLCGLKIQQQKGR